MTKQEATVLVRLGHYDRPHTDASFIDGPLCFKSALDYGCGYVCTLPQKHKGEHVAHVGDKVLLIWDKNGVYYKADL